MEQYRSGIVTKSIVGAEKFITTSRRGPCLEDIQSRRIWSLTTGKLLDECNVEDTPDAVLNRKMLEPDNIRIELTLKSVEALYKRKGPDVVEVYSRPRLCQEASSQKFSGVTMRPGWSLDLTVPDPATGEPWDLSDLRVQSRVIKLIRGSDPFCYSRITTVHAILEIARTQQRQKVSKGCEGRVRSRATAHTILPQVI